MPAARPLPRRLALLAVASALAIAGCQRTPSSAADQPAAPAMAASPDAIRAHVTFLADDALEG